LPQHFFFICHHGKFLFSPLFFYAD
jgi:hypothetical protein